MSQKVSFMIIKKQFKSIDLQVLRHLFRGWGSRGQSVLQALRQMWVQILRKDTDVKHKHSLYCYKTLLTPDSFLITRSAIIFISPIIHSFLPHPLHLLSLSPLSPFNTSECHITAVQCLQNTKHSNMFFVIHCCVTLI